jgi:hypothetical protein
MPFTKLLNTLYSVMKNLFEMWQNFISVRQTKFHSKLIFRNNYAIHIKTLLKVTSIIAIFTKTGHMSHEKRFCETNVYKFWNEGTKQTWRNITVPML